MGWQNVVDYVLGYPCTDISIRRPSVRYVGYNER